MKRTIIWSLVAGLALVTLVTVWFLQNFEQVPSSHREPPQKEARRNPYLALEHLLKQLNRPLERVNSPSSLDQLAAGGVLILDGNRRRNVDPARSERLLNWVGQGGYLIVAAESASDDPLLKKLGISPYQPPQGQCKPGRKDADKGLEKAATTTVLLPANNTGYRLERFGRGLASSQPEPAWRAGVSDERNSLLHFAWGRGHITVVDDMSFLSNYRIGELDHAELIWALLQNYQPQGTIHLASRMETQTLWQWLAESAWMLLISSAVLTALWLWQIIPRFGGTLPMPIAERRDLAQHLSAIGRSVWREGGVAHWLASVRQAVQKRLSLRYPKLTQQDASEQRIALARIAACKTIDIASAMTAGRAQSTNEFCKAMQILQRLDQRL